MKEDKRKSGRISEFMPASVSLRDADGRLLAGPFSATIVDICREGACLLMSQVESGVWHLYRSPTQNSALSLQLVIDQPGQALQLIINARPVWLNTFERDEFREKIMGLTFTTAAGDPGGVPQGPAERP